MTTRVSRIAALAVLAMIAYSAAAFAQLDYPAEIKKTAALLKDNPGSQTNRVRLATLYYLYGSTESQAGKHGAAVADYKAGLATLEEKGHAVPETDTAYQALRYGLGYSYRALGQTTLAVATLDQLAREFPKLQKGRYLLGVTLVESVSPKNVTRGIEVLTQLAAENSGSTSAVARRAALRMAFNYGTVLANQGNAAQAAQMMLALNPTGTADGAASDAEKQALLYGAAYFKLKSGDTTSAIADFEVLHGMNPDFKLRNGVTLAAVLASAYFQAGREQLENNGLEALKLSVEMLDLAEKTGNPKAADVNYGKAVAYLKMGKGFETQAAKELDIALQKDPEYLKRITASR